MVLPDWWKSDSPEELKFFLTFVTKVLDAQEHDYVLDQSEGNITFTSGSLTSSKMYLGNLARVALERDRSTWDELIRDHLQSGLKALHDSGQAPAKEVFLASLKLRLQVEVIDNPEAEIVYKDFAGPLRLELAFDTPLYVRKVTHSDLKEYGLSIEDAFELGRSNLWKEVANLEADVHRLPNGEPIFVLQNASSHFVASSLLFTERFISLDFKQGAVVALPSRDLAIFYPVRTTKWPEALQILALSTRDFFNRAIGSLSEDLYWWHDGRVDCLPVQIIDGDLFVGVPPEFVDKAPRIEMGKSL